MRKQRQKKRIAAAQNRCILGSGDIPEWCRAKVMPYRKMDGSVGYELHGAEQVYEMTAGDRLIKSGNRIRVKRKAIQ